MNMNYTWKYLVIAAVAALAFLSMWRPYERDPIEVFQELALNKDQAFEETVTLARSNVTAAREAKLNDNPLVKLREAVTEKKLDLRTYFPRDAKPDAKDPNADILARIERKAAGKIQLGLDLKGGTSFLLRMDYAGIDSFRHQEVRNQAIEIIRKRVDRFGVAEPIIQAVGDDRILVQIPGLSERDRMTARETIKRTAALEFRLVHPNNPQLAAQAALDSFMEIPAGYKKLTRVEIDNGREVEQIVFVRAGAAAMKGNRVTSARVAYSDFGAPYVSLQLDGEGAKEFGAITAANVGRQLAILLDGQLFSAPVINDAIMGGQAMITGQFTVKEASELANTLENPLEAPVSLLEERSVDPSLGRDSIQSGLRAAMVGAAAVVVFMLVYYLFAGLVADVVLMLNLLILVGVLAFFKFTLTLPGIAGIVLTIGMAVDANVLIYERIREELASHKTLLSAIIAGYQRAFLVIFDSNFTTIMTAMILIWLGSGPVKGFGVTLTIGLLANLFAAVFVTRVIFESLAAKGVMKSFHVLKLVPATRINFLGLRRWAYMISGVLVLAGAVSFVSRGGFNIENGLVYGIDFTGGEVVTMAFEEKIPAENLGKSLDAGGFTERLIQYQAGSGDHAQVLMLRLAEGQGNAVVGKLQADFPQAKFEPISTETVGAMIGHELMWEAALAMLVAVLGIAIYVAFRFGEMSYGVGAVVALFHDVVITVGLFCLTGRTFSMPMVAALLTIIGYSINDTIVVYDRIRENRKLGGTGKLHYFDLINHSVNQTLSRTLLTAGTTLLSALALYFLGGHVINDFAFTFAVGVIVGTYSSIYIASTVVLWFHRAEEARVRAAETAEAARA
jgi:SecD/SecF fusion protein